jgi:predicted lipoprotein
VNYLFFGPNAISKFSTNTAARVKYAKDIVTRIKTLTDNVAAAWPSYKTDFIANTRTNVGSPIGSIVNQLAYQMDVMKGPRIGWPFGKQSNGIVFASKCEAYFAGISAVLAVQNMTALKTLYTAGGSGKGISDYVISLNRASLNTDIIAQFDLVIAKLKLIPDPLSTTLTAQPALVEDAYKEIQKLLTLLKTDLASATAVQISYMDNDGD